MKRPKSTTPLRYKYLTQENRLGQFFSSMPAWALFLLVIATCVLTAYAGSITAQYRLSTGMTEAEAPIGTAVAATLGLLAFMFGFTFSLTAERYSERKNLVVQHANALETCYLRTSLIPEKQKLEIRNHFREYIALMLDLHKAADMEKLLARIDQLQMLIWQQTASLLQEDMDSEIRSIFTGSVNDVINAYRLRKTIGLIFRIPDAIWVALLLLTATGMFSYGYQNGIKGMGLLFSCLYLPLLSAWLSS